ncbi:GH23755 [Drosophila grimshawi]|uniref:GH23755 n=1 Tax=Drosophila grimshawi TaxID=7222 RepID=B4JZY8_DROGR|nr:GH23755 [Drosophila grimshawi]
MNVIVKCEPSLSTHVPTSPLAQNSLATRTSVHPSKVVEIMQKRNLHFDGTDVGLSVDEFMYRVKVLTDETMDGDINMYCQFMEEYERLEQMSLVTEPNLSEPHYYIPHHCVLKPSSESTKLRVVFDASCRTSNQTSLNDHLLVGPTLQDDLYLLLLRFRLHCYAITADITKMYRQVNVDLNDRKYHYIL